jgi:hypothetical protein
VTTDLGLNGLSSSQNCPEIWITCLDPGFGLRHTNNQCAKSMVLNWVYGLLILTCSDSICDFSKGRIFVSSMKISACSLLHRMSKFQVTKFVIKRQDVGGCKRRLRPIHAIFSFWVSFFTPVAGSIFGPLSTRWIERFHFEDGLISTFYFVPYPRNLVRQVLLCARSFHTLNPAISFRRWLDLQILLRSF